MRALTFGTLFFLANAIACTSPESEQDADLGSTGTSWSEFRTLTHQETESGLYVVDGDIPVEGLKQLREFYETYVQDGALIVNRINSADDRWDDAQKLNLTYCVGKTQFGSRYDRVVTTMAAAASNWQAVANIRLIHKPEHDGNCTASNTSVVFDVRPVNSGGKYTARAFFPSSSRSSRNVLIDGSAFSLSTSRLTGVLTHELGHALGFRHEHTRPEAATCFEDTRWRALTPYDSASVMHYPQCRGTGDLTLTSLDAQGAATLYGGPGGAGTTTPPPPAPTGTSVTTTLSGTVQQGENRHFGPFPVLAGSIFQAAMTGSGDPDLYVRFGAAPTTSSYACRPYKDGAIESCRLTVPSGQTSAYVMVRGYTAATFSVALAYVTAAAPATTDTLAPTFAGLTSATVVGSGEVRLGWTAGTDNLADSSTLIYDVYQSTGSTVSFTSPSFSTAPGAAAVAVTGLSPSTQYSFAVRARDPSGNRETNGVVRTVTTAAATTLPPSDNETFEQNVLLLVNQRRAAGASCGTTSYPAVAPVARHTALVTSARLHSEDMAANNYFSHTSLDGRTPSTRMRAAGFNGTVMGENIAAGYTTPESVVQAWMNSPGHCANIMRAAYKYLGVGYTSGGSYGHYWTQDFGG